VVRSAAALSSLLEHTDAKRRVEERLHPNKMVRTEAKEKMAIEAAMVKKIKLLTVKPPRKSVGELLCGLNKKNTRPSSAFNLKRITGATIRELVENSLTNTQPTTLTKPATLTKRKLSPVRGALGLPEVPETFPQSSVLGKSFTSLQETTYLNNYAADYHLYLSKQVWKSKTVAEIVTLTSSDENPQAPLPFYVRIGVVCHLLHEETFPPVFDQRPLDANARLSR